MAILEILKFPDSRLRTKCSPVEKITPDLIKLAEDMLETMYRASGLGLSAIQVNHFVRLITADTKRTYSQENERYDSITIMGEKEQTIKQPIVLFNPEILSSSGKVIFKEGCLSFPSYYAEVKRASYIECRGLDLSGTSITIKTDGLLAICIQHEIDHLNGKLFIDHLSTIKAYHLKAQIKKYGYPEIPCPETKSSK